MAKAATVKLRARRDLARTCVIGLGKLGAPLAAVLASRGFEVTGVDLDPAVVTAVNAGRAPVAEPGLQALFDTVQIRATTDLVAAVRTSDAIFVIVPTPSAPDGTFEAAAVVEAVRKIGAAFHGQGDEPLVVVVSTLTPGAMQADVQPALDAAAGRTIGLCYSPAFVALGNVIAGMLRPDFVLVGQSDAGAGERLAAIYAQMCETPADVRRMGFIDAELTKLAVNGFVTTKISYANMISELCDRLPGADAAIVMAAVGADSRIGPKGLAPALAYGGPCFPRDNAALAAVARAAGGAADLAEATDRINRRQVDRILALVRARMATGTVGVLGLAYKAGTGVCEASPGLAIALGLAEAGYCVLASDPAASAEVLAGRAEFVAEPAECVRRSDLVIIATPWPEFAALPREAFQRPGGRLAVIDGWRLLSVDNVDLTYLGGEP